VNEVAESTLEPKRLGARFNLEAAVRIVATGVEPKHCYLGEKPVRNPSQQENNQENRQGFRVTFLSFLLKTTNFLVVEFQSGEPDVAKINAINSDKWSRFRPRLR